MAIFKGDTLVKRIYKGNDEVFAVFKGTAPVHPEAFFRGDPEVSGWQASTGGLPTNTFQFGMRNFKQASGNSSVSISGVINNNNMFAWYINTTGYYNIEYESYIKMSSGAVFITPKLVKYTVENGVITNPINFRTGSEYTVQQDYVRIIENYNVGLTAGDYILPAFNNYNDVPYETGLRARIFGGY